VVHVSDAVHRGIGPCGATVHTPLRHKGFDGATPTPRRPPVRDERLHQHFGAVQVGTNLNNEAIDADLAHVYGKGVESYD